jgi:hypothetical protein
VLTLRQNARHDCAMTHEEQIANIKSTLSLAVARAIDKAALDLTSAKDGELETLRRELESYKERCADAKARIANARNAVAAAKADAMTVSPGGLRGPLERIRAALDD